MSVFQFLPQLPYALDTLLNDSQFSSNSVFGGGEGRAQVSLSGSHVSSGIGWVFCSLSPLREL